MSFLLYYVPVTLCGILPDKYYVHVMLLVKAVRILLATKVCVKLIDVAENVLQRFCKLMEEHYG